MTAVATTPWAAVASRVTLGGTAVIAAYGPLLGGFIVNPASPEDQGIGTAETLFVDLVSTASASEGPTTFPVQPGQYFFFPAGFDGVVSVNAATSGHRFSAFVLHEAANFVPPSGDFPPSGPTTMLKTINSYLYWQYADDENLQLFFDAYNEFSQQYVDWFATVGLPVYTGLSGPLLDWVVVGLYGLSRPALPSGKSQNLGALNTYRFNTLTLNVESIVGPPTYYLTDDDIFKRIITWSLFKGDGLNFNIRWLKRRVMRFLTGTDGTAGQTDATYQVSVTFGIGNEININLQSTRRYARGGAIFGAGLMNGFRFNELVTTSVMIPISPLVPVFKAAMEAGVLPMPFQFSVVVND